MLRNMNRSRAWVALIVSVLLTGVFFPSYPAGAALDKAKINRAMLATVKIIILDPDGKPFGTCSGTHVGDGYIVANWHCVGHTDLYGADDTGMGLKNGDTYNPDGLVVIAPQKDPKQLPKPTFIARVVAGNPDVDVSVVKIISMLDQKTALPSTLPMGVMTQDDSDKVNVGDPVYIFGYPGAGGDLITYSEGTISGFEDQTGDGEPDSFKTTAAISPGNSGGLAVDQDGNQIGIPTYQSTVGSGLGGLREINIAVPYIAQAKELGGATPGATKPGITATPGPQATPGGTNSPFGPLTFGTDVQNGKLVDEGTAFPTGTAQIIGAFPFQGMRNGMKWGWVWQYNGKTVIDSRNKATWSDGASGVTAVQLSNTGGLPDGSYTSVLYVSNAPVQQGSFTIGSAQGNTTPAPPTPDPSGTGVVLKGRIVDADTSRGVAGGVVVVLKPGTTLDEWDNSKGDELAAAIGVADQDGYYLTSPELDRGQTYTVIVAGQNYTRRVFEDGLAITADDPALVELDDLAIQKK